MQVENEVGVVSDSRDRCPAANEAYAKPVPKALMHYLVKHKATLAPELLEVWPAHGNKTSDTWEGVFGPGKPPEVRLYGDDLTWTSWPPIASTRSSTLRPPPPAGNCSCADANTCTPSPRNRVHSMKTLVTWFSGWSFTVGGSSLAADKTLIDYFLNRSMVPGSTWARSNSPPTS